MILHPLLINSDLTKIKIAFNSVAQHLCYSNSRTKYTYDENNSKQITDVLNYLICSPDSEMQFHKGLFFIGGVGTGKTLIVQIIKELVTVSNKIIDIMDARDIAYSCVNVEKYDSLKKGLLCIDDLGTEPTQIKEYGTDKNPIIDLIAARYRDKRYTIMTTNLDADELKLKYDSRFLDRCNEMFNIVSLKGSSRRK